MRLSLTSAILLASASIVDAQEITMGDLKDRISGCNQELKVYDSDISTARINQQSVSVQSLPTLTLNLNGYVNEETNQSDITANMPLYTFGAQQAKETVADQKLGLSQVVREQKLQSLTKLVAENLIKLQYTRQKTTALEFYLDRLIELERTVQNRTKVGLSAQAELLEVANELISKRTALSELEKLSLEIQGNLRRDNCGNSEFLLTLPVVETVATKKTAALDKNADLNAIDRKISVEKSEIEVAETSSRPTLNARAVKPVAGKEKIGLSLNYTYEHFGRSQQIKVQKQREALEKARRELASKETELREALVMTIEQVNLLSQKLIPELSEHLDVLEKTLESKLRLLDGGRADVAEVVNAYQQMSQAEVRLLEQKMNLELNIINVEHMVGLQ
jgi:outer membrane protein TolC